MNAPAVPRVSDRKLKAESSYIRPAVSIFFWINISHCHPAERRVRFSFCFSPAFNLIYLVPPRSYRKMLTMNILHTCAFVALSTVCDNSRSTKAGDLSKIRPGAYEDHHLIPKSRQTGGSNLTRAGLTIEFILAKSFMV